LSATDFDTLIQEYNWTSKEIVFEEGMDLSVTGFDNFEWHSLVEAREFLRQERRYYGYIYLDITNRILFFDISF